MKWKIFLLIAVISAAVYSNSFHNSFHFDDQHYIVENTYIRDIRNIPSFFLSPRLSSFEKVFTGHYRPLVVTSYAINYAAGSLRPAGYHTVNLLFHIGSSYLIYLILQVMLFRGKDILPAIAAGNICNNQRDKNVPPIADRRGFLTPSVAAALVFAVHPFNSEVINYITARSSVMCAFFYLLSFYFWIRFRQASLPVVVSTKQHVKDAASGRFIYYIASLLAFVLAMLSKEVAITLPVVLILYDLFFCRSIIPLNGSLSHEWRRFFRRSLACLPFILIVVVPYLAYRLSVYGYIVGGVTRKYMTNILTQPEVLLKNIQLMFIPYGLTIDHNIRSSMTFYDSTVVLSFIAIFLILGIAYLLFRLGDKWRVISFFILWFFITLLPTTIIPLNAVLQENRGYLAGVVFAVITGICISKLNKKLLLPVSVLIIIVLSILTVQRNIVWRDDLSLWSDAVAKAPMSARAHDNLGLAYMGVKRYDLALDEFNKTLGIHPRYYLAYYNAGVIYQLLGDFRHARSAYEASLKINPSYFRSYYNVGIVYKQLGELEMAITSYEKAIAIDARHPFVYNNLGIALMEKGDLKKAESAFRRAIAVNPGYEKAYYNLGNVYFSMKDYGRAADAYRAAVRIRPDYREADEMLRQARARE